MPEFDANKKHYFAPVSKEEVPHMVKDVAKRSEVLILWKKGDEEGKEEFTPEGFDEKNLTIDLKRVAKGLFSKFTSSSLKGEKVFVKSQVDKLHYFTTSLLQYSEERKTYFVAITNPVFVSQQRSNYRLVCDNINVKVNMQFPDGRLIKCLDISAGGTSFVVPEFEKTLYAKGKVFENVFLNFNRTRYEIPKVEVVGMWEYKERGSAQAEHIKLGVSFQEMDKDVEENIFRQVNSEARAEEIRKRFNF